MIRPLALSSVPQQAGLGVALGGAIVGALFYPGCHRIFQSARSATRARHGSLVAALDRRNVLATVLAGIAACSITQVPALLRAQFSSRAPSSVQAALSVVLSMCVLVIFHRLRKQNADDWQKLTALGYHGQWETVAEPLATAENSLDLGLGEEHLAARTARGYRDLGGQASLRGSIEEATAAFVAGDAYHHRAMLVAVASLTASLATCFFAWRSA